jgi:biofilm PGA synthesis protein PgaA
MNVPARGKVAARAYRNQKNWNDSLAIWESVLQEEPDNVDVRTGWIMTLADARYNQQALTEANKWAQAHPGLILMRYLPMSTIRREKLGCIVSCQPGG